MSYDNWKLQQPSSNEGISIKIKCKCGKSITAEHNGTCDSCRQKELNRLSKMRMRLNELRS